MARGPCALRPVENQRTAYGARTERCGLGVVVFAANAGRFNPRRWPRLLFTVTALGWWLPLRSTVTEALEFRGVQPANASPRGEQADVQGSTHSLADLA